MALSVKNLHIEYPGNLLFECINLDVATNEIIAVVTQVLDGGTSLLRGIGGFLSGVGGRVLLNDEDLLTCSAADRAINVGYIYEDHGLISLYTVFRNIVLPLQYHTELTDEEIHHRLIDVCDYLGLDEAMFGLKPHEINDVQTRLVNLARGLIIKPKLLLIDELEGGMSEEYLHVTMNTLREKQSANPMAIIITTSSDFVMENSDRIFRIENHDLVLE